MLKRILSFSLITFLVVPLFALVSAQGTITGTVVDAESGDELPGATVQISALNLGTNTDVNGDFTFDDVQSGTHRLSVRFVGYREYQEQITVEDGEEVTLEIQLRTDVLGLDELVVTGVIGDTEARYTPFSVGRVSSEDIQIAPPTTAESALRGRLPGVSVSSGSGQPGSGASVQLRGVTSMATGNSPLYIVDGVILGSASVDIDALDIESIEVVRGAAAASLYGSRAASGVVQITTQSGNLVEDGTTEITVRNEYGVNELDGSINLNRAHRYAMSGDEDQPWVDSDGNPTANLQARDIASAFYEFEYPDGVETFDHLDRFFDPGDTYTNYVNVRSRVGATNFSLSFNNTHEQGVLDQLDGYTRRNLRANVDSDLTDNLNLGFRGYYSWSKLDHVQTGSGSPFFGLMYMQPEVDISQRDEDGRFVPNPDGLGLEDNPIYDVAYNDRTQRRQRIMGSVNADYDVTDWFMLSGDFSYDRSNRNSHYFYPHFWEQVDQNPYPGGGIWESNAFDEAINASVDGIATQNFGDLRTRTRVRWLIENQEYEWIQSDGNDFTVAGVPQFSNLDQTTVESNSEKETIRSEGFFAITNLNYDNRYIFDLLGRRDGSSLFGPDERWNTYYRASASWNLSNEDFFNVDPVDDLIFRASRGTAGNRPQFHMQYETWNVVAGSVSKQNLGNTTLKPEHATEHEFGMQLGLFDRFLLEATYSHTETDDQILLVSQQALQGYGAQWQNAGTLETDALEISLDAHLVNTQQSRLSMNLNFDWWESNITRFDAPPHRYGTGGGFETLGTEAQASNVFLYDVGETFGTFYGTLWAEDTSTLPVGLQEHRDMFDRNDDGYLVPVGEGGSWRDARWGETVEVGGEELDWGMPVAYEDEEGDDFQRLGNAIPDFSMSWGTQFRYGNIGMTMLWEGEFGGEIYNHTRQWSYRDGDELHGDFDQTGKPEDERKPANYYTHLYNVNSSSSHFVEDGTYVKLRELSLSYRLGQETLSGLFRGAVNYINLSVVGRNLLTFTDYSGFDPEVGEAESNHIRFDSFNYPNYRSITGTIEFQF